MTSEFPFLKNVREALNIPKGAERTKNMFPTLFAKKDKSNILENIAKRSFTEKEQLIDELSENCTPLGITLHVVDNETEAEDVAVEIIRTKDPEFSYNRHIIQHNHPDIAAMKLWKRFNRESVTIHTTYPGDSETIEKTIASYIGITAPSITIAESATLVQLTEPGCPRSTSLVPSIHIALIRSENLVASLEEAYALLEDLAPKESFVFISGPSKTADIEAHLVHGAHGPKEVHIILLKEAEIVPEPVPIEEVVSDESLEDTATTEVTGNEAPETTEVIATEHAEPAEKH
ncbi:MAG: L-lactate dehydrogenase complex protein LldG [Desulforhopalus sp.]|jgi:L-lactate dehydrogenase complex protein LldG